MNKSFKHSGDMGDIVYSLPTVKALGGGVLNLDVDGGSTSPYVHQMVRSVGRDRLKFDRMAFDFLMPLLVKQPYITGVGIWNKDIDVDHDLDMLRSVLVTEYMKGLETNICFACARAFNVDFDPRKPWIEVPESGYPDYDLVVSRTLRYHGNHVFWETNKKFICEKKAVFVGTDLEYQVFEEVFGYCLPHEKVESALQLAQIISKGREFAGNQSLPMAIAIGLGKNFTQEVFRQSPNCRFRWGTYV